MRIVDAVTSSNTKNEVEFLLTAYTETLQFCGAARYLPANAALLPLSGIDDIEHRLGKLLSHNAGGSENQHYYARSGILREATEIFGAACLRLRSLQTKPQEGTKASLSFGNREHAHFNVSYVDAFAACK